MAQITLDGVYIGKKYDLFSKVGKELVELPTMSYDPCGRANEDWIVRCEIHHACSPTNAKEWKLYPRFYRCPSKYLNETARCKMHRAVLLFSNGWTPPVLPREIKIFSKNKSGEPTVQLVVMIPIFT